MAKKKTKRFPELFEDKILKFAFDNVRNVLICYSLLVATAAIIRFRGQLVGGECINWFLAIVLGVAAVLLLVWNMAHGGKKVWTLLEAKKRIALLVFIVFFGMYFALGFALVSAMLKYELLKVTSGDIKQAISHFNEVTLTEPGRHRL